MVDVEAIVEATKRSKRPVRKLLYTSYFAMVSKLPDYMCPIAICGSVPAFWKDRPWTKKLAPKWWFFNEWKKNHDNEMYTKRFYDEVLSTLRPEEVLGTLYDISGGKIPCMICYEKPMDFCHRHIVADWLNDSIPHLTHCSEYIFNRRKYTPYDKKD